MSDDDGTTTTTRGVWRRVAVVALVLSVALPVIGLAVTYLDPRFGDPCRPRPSGAVSQAFPSPVLALTLSWAGLTGGLTCLACGTWWLRTAGRSLSGRTHGRWVLILACAAILILLNGLVLWNVYATWVYGRPDCAW